MNTNTDTTETDCATFLAELMAAELVADAEPVAAKPIVIAAKPTTDAHKCHRCGGSGYLAAYAHNFAGVCFHCWGSGAE